MTVYQLWDRDVMDNEPYILGTYASPVAAQAACDALNEANRKRWVAATSPEREREIWNWRYGQVKPVHVIE